MYLPSAPELHRYRADWEESVKSLLAGAIAIAAFLGSTTPSPAQEDSPRTTRVSNCTVRGTIENMQMQTPLVAELAPAMGSGITMRTDVHPHGDFLFDDVPTGDYRLRITTAHGEVVYEKLVFLTDTGEYLAVRLPERKVGSRGGGAVSIKALERKIPGQALKEMNKSAEASHKGDVQNQIEHLRKAIQAYPDYMEAHNDLAACYVRLNRREDALAELETASRLDPDAALVNVNLSSLLVLAHRYSEAETAARRALRFDPANDRARLALALSLRAQNRGESEALDNFRRAAQQFPRARLAAAGILIRQGDTRQAAAELREFLQAAITPEERAAVQSWLAQLE